ncbi:cyclin-like protein [Aspergillus aurantiobrunneus]
MAYHKRPTSSYQPCDTFFVESYDDFPVPRIDPKEHAKLIARERQYAIADELSRVTSEEYREDVLTHMLDMDASTLPDVESIDIQTEIQWFMRPYLLDFLIEAHTAFQLLPSTLFLTVNLLDRYCSKRVVYKRHYQLVGCAALLIAAKYGDKKDRVPTIRELKSMCCSLYDDDMFIQMEWHVLQTLGWTIGHPTVDTFLQMAVMDTPYDAEVEHLALYITEISLFHREFVSKPSSDLAKASLALSRCILNRPQPRHTEWASQYDSMTLVGLSQQLHQPSQVLARKYSSSHYSRVSKILEQFLARQASIASYTPPSPPSDVVISESKPYEGEMGLATPQKAPHPSNMPHGYITPPITPENEAFINGSNAVYAKAVPVPSACSPSPTPSPSVQYMTHNPYQQESTYVPQQQFLQPQMSFTTGY